MEFSDNCTTPERIAHVAKKLQARGLRLNPALSESSIAEFEKRCGTTLPEGYRLFLRELGNGAVGPPTYGLLPLGEIPAHLSDGEHRAQIDLTRVRRPFPFTEL